MADKPMVATSQAQARMAGVRFYQGATCATHPDALRYAANARCVECAKAERRASQSSADYRARDAARKRMARAPQQFADLLG